MNGNIFNRYEDIYEQDLSDNKSKMVLESIILSKLTGDEKYYWKIYENNQYFALPEFLLDPHEYFIDAGAYTGDTVEQFINMHHGFFDEIHAFEPGKEALGALKIRTKRLLQEWAKGEETIKIYQNGLGDKKATIRFAKNNDWGQGLSLSNAIGEAEIVNILSLDELKLKKATLLKADVEGMELQLLKGAEKTILRDRPKLAICTYHKPNDIIDLIDYIKLLDLRYKISLRHHSYSAEETVIYCY